MELVGILFKLPMPPTANKQLMPVRGRLIKTNAARVFDKQIAFYKLVNFKKIEELKGRMEALLKKGAVFRLEIYFCFPREKLFTKKNEMKMLDVDNRLKSCTDSFVKLIGIDDKHFVQTKIEKVLCKLSDGKEYIHLIVYQLGNLTKIRCETEILENHIFQPALGLIKE